MVVFIIDIDLLNIPLTLILNLKIRNIDFVQVLVCPSFWTRCSDSF